MAHYGMQREHCVRLEPGRPPPTESRVRLASDPQLFFKATFSPDNRWLTTEIFSNPMQLRRVSSEGGLGDPTVLEGADKFVSGIAFSPDGLWLAMINSHGALHVYDLAAVHPAANPKWTSSADAELCDAWVLIPRTLAGHRLGGRDSTPVGH